MNESLIFHEPEEIDALMNIWHTTKLIKRMTFKRVTEDNSRILVEVKPYSFITHKQFLKILEVEQLNNNKQKEFDYENKDQNMD